MPPRKRTSSAPNGDARDESKYGALKKAYDALALAEEAEAEAAEAEALAAAGGAGARALRLRRQAEAAVVAHRSQRTASADAHEVVGPVEVDDAEATAAESARQRRLKLPRPRLELPRPRLELRRPGLELRRPRLKVVAAALVILCTLGLFGVSGYMLWHHHQVVAEKQQLCDHITATLQSRRGEVTFWGRGIPPEFNHGLATAAHRLSPAVAFKTNTVQLRLHGCSL